MGAMVENAMGPQREACQQSKRLGQLTEPHCASFSPSEAGG